MPTTTAMTVDREPVTTAQRQTWGSPAVTRVAPTSDSPAATTPHTPAAATLALGADGTRGAVGTPEAPISAADRTSGAGPIPVVAATSDFDARPPGFRKES